MVQNEKTTTSFENVIRAKESLSTCIQKLFQRPSGKPCCVCVRQAHFKEKKSVGYLKLKIALQVLSVSGYFLKRTTLVFLPWRKQIQREGRKCWVWERTKGKEGHKAALTRRCFLCRCIKLSPTSQAKEGVFSPEELILGADKAKKHHLEETRRAGCWPRQLGFYGDRGPSEVPVQVSWLPLRFNEELPVRGGASAQGFTSGDNVGQTLGHRARSHRSQNAPIKGTG